jgi:NTP pyrophosphatase (non-canonical NTP hydrolase)
MNANMAACRALEYSKAKGWERDWSHGGCYLHLEASEFIESLRGKKGDPQKELADTLFVLFSVAAEHELDVEAAIKWVGSQHE